MVDSIKRTFDPVAILATTIFVIIGFSISGAVYGSGQYDYVMTARQGIELVLFSASGALYGLITTRRRGEYKLIDLISTATWALLCTGVASAAPAFFTAPGNLVSWTVIGMYGELLAAISTASILVLRDPAILQRIQ